MFPFFKRKSKLEKLQIKYKKLLSEAHELSTISRSKSDEKTAEANEVLKEIERIQNEAQ